MAQAAARLEVPEIQMARRSPRIFWRQGRPDNPFAGVRERGRQRKQLVGYRSTQDMGRGTGIRV